MLLGKVIKPVGAGMAVMFAIDSGKFKLYMEDIYNVPKDEWEDILDILEGMLAEWQANMKDAYFTEEDYKSLLEPELCYDKWYEDKISREQELASNGE